MKIPATEAGVSLYDNEGQEVRGLKQAGKYKVEVEAQPGFKVELSVNIIGV